MSMSQGDGRIVNMTELYRELFKIIDSGKTVVMPSSESARSLLADYVRSNESHRVVSASAAISMQDMLEKEFPEYLTMDPASNI